MLNQNQFGGGKGGGTFSASLHQAGYKYFLTSYYNKIYSKRHGNQPVTGQLAAVLVHAVYPFPGVLLKEGQELGKELKEQVNPRRDIAEHLFSG